MLAILTPYAFKILREKKWGATYSNLLILIAVFAFVYSGVFTPKNPYTANPYSPSLSGLVTQSEALQLQTISQLLGPGLYLTDWRSGLFIWYYYLFSEPLWQGFKYDDIVFRLGGSYGLYINLIHLERFKGLIILRNGALNMPEVYDQDAISKIRDRQNTVIYMSKDIEIWLPA